MGGSHGINVVCLHQPDILDHILQAERAARIAGKFVAVCALEYDTLAVQQHEIALDLELAEADLAADSLKQRAVLSSQG